MRAIVLITVLLSAEIVSAQQTPIFNNYFVNPYILNPALAGAGETTVFMDFRKQWDGIIGAPESQMITVDGALSNQKTGLGFTAYNDLTNVFSRVSGMFTFAQQFNFSEKHHIRLGLSGGITQNKIQFDKINAEDPTESVIMTNNQNATAFDGIFGFSYSLHNLKLGFVANQLLESSFEYESSFTERQLDFGFIRHYSATMSYDFKIKDDWELSPILLLRSAQGVKAQFDGNLKLAYQKVVWMNLAYRHNVAYAISLGGVIDNKIIAGYTYELPSTQLANHSSGSHEIILGYRIGKSSGQGGLSERQLKKIQDAQDELYEKTDFLEQENEKQDKEIEEQKIKLDNFIDGLEQWKDSVRLDEDALRKFIEENEFQMKGNGTESNQNNSGNNQTANSDGSSNQNQQDDGSKPNSDDDKDDQSGRDNLNEELDPSHFQYYVIVGACRKLNQAKDFQKIVLREYELSTKVVRNSRDTWYLIYSAEINSVKEAKKELKKARASDTKGIYFGKPWIYRHAK